ncbi:unnamed protein product, partial [Larinioides sclopetarius]
MIYFRAFNTESISFTGISPRTFTISPCRLVLYILLQTCNFAFLYLWHHRWEQNHSEVSTECMQRTCFTPLTLDKK